VQVFIAGGGVAAVEGDLSGGSGYLVMILGVGGVAGPGSRRRAKFNQQTPSLISGFTLATHRGRSKSHV